MNTYGHNTPCGLQNFLYFFCTFITSVVFLRSFTECRTFLFCFSVSTHTFFSSHKSSYNPRRFQHARRFQAFPQRTGAPIVRSHSNLSLVTDASQPDAPSPSAHLSSRTNSPSEMLTPSSQSTAGSEAATIGARPANYRHSLEMMEQQKYNEAASDAPTPTNNGNVLSTPPKLQPSFSANDVPTLKQVSGSGVGTTPNHAAQQHLHNHNASMGRIPAGALRHSRELSADGRDNNATAAYQSLGSTLHANATPFITPSQGLAQAPALSQGPQTPVASAIGNPQGVSPFINGYYNTPGSYASNGYGNNPNGYASTPGGYSSTGSAGLAGPSGYTSPATTLTSGSNSGMSGGMNGGLIGNMSGGFNGGQSGGQHGFPLLNMMSNLNLNGTNGYSPANGYTSANYASYNPVYTPPQPRDSQARVIQTRRQQDNEGKYKSYFLS